jgi:hypothetical protein
LKAYIHQQIHLDIKPRHNGQLHVVEKIVRLENAPGEPHWWWQLRNTVTGEILDKNETWFEVLITAAALSYEVVPMDNHKKQEQTRLSEMPCQEIEDHHGNHYSEEVRIVAEHLAEYFDQHCTAFADVPEAFADWIVDNYVSEKMPQFIINDCADCTKIDVYSVLEEDSTYVWDIINYTIHKRAGII